MKTIMDMLPAEWTAEIITGYIAVGFALSVLGSVGALSWLRNRGNAMLNNDQKQKIADILVDGLLELHAKDELTAKQVNRLCENFAKQHGLWDCMPSKLIKVDQHAVDEPLRQLGMKEKLKQKWGGLLHKPTNTEDDQLATLLAGSK